MKTSSSSKPYSSLIDANINRAKEGLRVCEDVARFFLGSKKLSSLIKSIRHNVDSCSRKACGSYIALLKSRDSGNDAGRRIKNDGEFRRAGLRDVLASNFKRAEESLRVLEELSKLYNRSAAADFKELRYMVYEAEKKTILAFDKKS